MTATKKSRTPAPVTVLKQQHVVTATYPKGAVRQVFPTSGEAERYADSLRKRAKQEKFKDILITAKES